MDLSKLGVMIMTVVSFLMVSILDVIKLVNSMVPFPLNLAKKVKKKVLYEIFALLVFG